MKGAKGILASFRVVETLLLSRISPSGVLHFHQASPFPHLSPLFFSSLSKYDFLLNTHQRVYFSSKPKTIIELVTTNEFWSKGLEEGLEKSHPTTLTHETVMYVLKNLEKNPQKVFDFFNWVSDKHGFKPNSMVHSAMLRILGNKESLNQFWVFIKKMSDQGCDVDENAYFAVLGNFKNSKMMTEATTWTEYFTKMTKESATGAMVKCVVDVVVGSDLKDVEKKLEELKVTLSETTILSIFSALLGYPSKALSFFHWLTKHKGYTHNAVTYNGILRVLGQQKSIKEFWSMVKEMKTAGHELDIDTYIKISRQFERSRMVKDSVRLYELMMDCPYKPPIQNCIHLLRYISMTDTPDINLVFRVVKKYEATGHALSKVEYDWIYRSLTTVGKFDEAENMLDTMRNAGFEPDNLTYRHGLLGLGKHFGHQEKCRLEKNDGAYEDLLEVLVNGLCSKRRVDNAYNLVIQCVDKANLRPLLSTYKSLIQNLLGEKKLEEAMNLLCLMRKHNYEPFRDLYVGYISKFGTVDDAREFLKALNVKRYPSPSIYLHVFQSFFKEGRKSEAQKLLDTCPHHICKDADILNLFALRKLGNATA